MAATVTVTNTNPVRTMMPRRTIKAQKSVDGLSYLVTAADGSVVPIALAIIDALYAEAPQVPAGMIDRPKGASAA